MRSSTPAAVALFVLSSAVHADFSAPDEVTPPQSGPGGALEGVVRLAGRGNPSPTTVENATDPETCGRRHDLDDLVVSPDNHGVRYVVAALVDVPVDRVPPRAPRRMVLANRDCRFDPHVQVASVGDTIVAANDDPTLHTTHYYGVLRGNISLPMKGTLASRVLRRAGMISVLCDVHGWMKAFVRVDAHPYHAVTDEQGHFRIAGIPPGSYTLEIWHERLGTRRVSVRVEPASTSRIELEYPVEPGEP